MQSILIQMLLAVVVLFKLKYCRSYSSEKVSSFLYCVGKEGENFKVELPDTQVVEVLNEAGFPR